VCARPAVPASVYQIVAGRSFHGTTAGRAFTSVGYSETKIKTASPTRAACEECRAPDQPTSRTRPPRWSPPRGRPKPDGWPPLSLHALTRVRMPGFPRAGRGNRQLQPCARKCTWNEPKPSVQRPTWSGSRPICAREVRPTPASRTRPPVSAHGGDISREDQHVREGLLNAGIVGTL
jgi:hypothetical protein